MRKPQLIDLENRFKVSLEQVLGEGSFGCVYRALDTRDNRQVAVKEFKGQPGCPDWPDLLDGFQQAVKTMQALADVSKTNPVTNGGFGHVSSFAAAQIVEDAYHFLDTKSGGRNHEAVRVFRNMDLSHCFMELISYSRVEVAGDVQPGLDPESQMLYMVLELGGVSLAETLERCAQTSTTLSTEDLRHVQWSLVSIVCGLHAAGFVHLDIKPCNVVRFGEVWKLIDYDGCLKSGAVVDPDNVVVTPWYMPPEMAAAFGTSSVQVSRLMDVWSVGLCALEAVFLQPVLKIWFDEWSKETGGDEKYYEWLADYRSEPAIMDATMCEAMDQISPDMSRLLQGMIVKDPSHRLDIAACLVHPWFADVRGKMWRHMRASLPACAESSCGSASEGLDARTPKAEPKTGEQATSVDQKPIDVKSRAHSQESMASGASSLCLVEASPKKGQSQPSLCQSPKSKTSQGAPAKNESLRRSLVVGRTSTQVSKTCAVM